MKLMKSTLSIALALFVSGCALTPEQKAEAAAKRLRAEQKLQVELAKQCDVETAELIHQQFNPPLSQTEKEAAEFQKRYAEKVGAPMFQACYKLALQNYQAKQELETMRMHYEMNDFGFFGHMRPYCYSCW